MWIELLRHIKLGNTITLDWHYQAGEFMPSNFVFQFFLNGHFHFQLQKFSWCTQYLSHYVSRFSRLSALDNLIGFPITTLVTINYRSDKCFSDHCLLTSYKWIKSDKCKRKIIQEITHIYSERMKKYSTVWSIS